MRHSKKHNSDNKQEIDIYSFDRKHKLVPINDISI